MVWAKEYVITLWVLALLFCEITDFERRCIIGSLLGSTILVWEVLVMMLFCLIQIIVMPPSMLGIRGNQLICSSNG